MKKFLLVFAGIAIHLGAQVMPIRWTTTTKKVGDCEYDLIFKAKPDQGWHLYSLNKAGKPKDDSPNPTVFTFAKSSDYELVGKVKQSTPHTAYDSLWELTVESYDKEATFSQKIKLLTSKKTTVKGKYEFQVCTNAQCLFHNDDFEFSLEGSAGCSGSVEAATFGIKTSSNVCVCDTEAILRSAAVKSPGKTEVKQTAAPAEKDNSIIENLSWWSIFLQGFIGGFAALLTPCVFPMIPMNVSFFTKQSKTKRQGIRNAFLYAIFLVVLYVGLGLGVTLAFGAGALHTLSTNVWFNLAFFLLLLIFAISFLGAFEIVLPSRFVNSMDARSERGGVIGIFFMAFTLALVSFSCTGPIIGTLLVQAAATGSLSDPFWGMFGFSLALAIPFGLFAAFPGWLNSLPKSGGWLNSVKVVLGFLELALALKFASNADLVVQAGILTREVFISLWIVIFGLQTAYLLGAFKTSHDSDLKHVSVTRLFFAIISLFVTIYLMPGLWGAPLKLFSGILPPLEYSESPHGFGVPQAGAAMTGKGSDEFSQHIETNKNGIVHFKNDYDLALAYAKKTGKPLMVDFTGHACANCRKTEDYIWPDAEVIKRLNNEVVLVSLYVDDKRELPADKQFKAFWYGKERLIGDIGDKFKLMEETLYGQSTQPLYVLLDHNEKPLNSVRGYKSDIGEYVRWLDEGIGEFKKRK